MSDSSSLWIIVILAFGIFAWGNSADRANAEDMVESIPLAGALVFLSAAGFNDAHNQTIATLVCGTIGLTCLYVYFLVRSRRCRVC